MAACYLRLNDGDNTLKYSNKVLKVSYAVRQVLEVDGRNPKALFRRGKAWFLKGDVDKAEEDLLLSAKYSAEGDAGIKAALEQVRKEKKVQERKQREQFKGIFDKKSDDSKKN